MPRLTSVIGGEQGGVSKSVGWTGGGCFIYAELMEKNRGFIKSIRDASTATELGVVFDFMLEEAEIDFKVDLEKVKDTLHTLSLEDQKKVLFKIIDKNQLYYNYSEIDDANVRELISDTDYSFNRSFMRTVVNRDGQNQKLPLLAELEALEESVFSDQIGWDIPDYIRQNMVHTFRNYQDQALRFHYTRASDRFRLRNIDHVLFNMATGSGKTDLMAALILYLYQEHNYQNFLFLVNTNSVLSKTVDNLITVVSDKYLYRHPIEVEGERVEIRKVNSFPRSQSKNTIYLKLATVQSVSSDIYTQKENSMATKDYGLHKVVVLGDEAHHYSASTKSEKEAEQSWEQAISKILEAHEENLLLEFTATIDLENRNVYEKYKDKIVYRYTLDRFIQDGYSKNVKRIQSSNTDLDNMLNVVLLSEYRRRYALEVHDTFVKPVVMFKSQTIDASNEANNRFNQLVDSLTEESLGDFLDRQVQIATADNSETLALAHAYFRAREADWPEIIRDIKREFAPSRIINANDSDRSNMLEKGQYEALNSLESLSNLYRVVFAVAKLTEGWDVLNLFDIVRLSDHPTVSGTKAKTISEAQLIGRGARYFPFLLNGQRSYTRRFSDDSEDSMILETLHYHTINEPQYLKNLVAALDEMNLPTGVDKRNPLIDVKIKKDFRRTNVWQKGRSITMEQWR